MTLSRRARTSWIVAAVLSVAVVTAAVVATQSFTRDREHSAGGAIGDWGEVADGRPSVTFAADGTFAGNDSCNGFSGRWREADDGVESYDTVMSLMACIDGRDQWLTSARTFRISGDRLSGYDESGAEIGSLSRRS